MALHRSKLGPVGGGGGGGKSDGGVAVDLDPLSAFALMGQGTEGASASGGTERGDSMWSVSNSSSGTRGASRSDQRSASPPVSAQRSAENRGWHAVEMNQSAPSRPPVEAGEIVGFSVPEARPVVLPVTPSNHRPVKHRSSLMATPSPLRQLNALGGSSQVNNFQAYGVNAGATPVFEDVVARPEATAERVDQLKFLKNEGIECLEGEVLVVKLQNASCEGLHGKMVPGVLAMTTYKLVVIPHSPVQRGGKFASTSQGLVVDTGADERYFPFGHLPKEYVQVPMTCIDKVERDSDRKGAPRADRYFGADVVSTIHCKDARRIRLSFGGSDESERAMKMLQQLAFPAKMENLFAFSHRTVDAGAPDPGWHIYDAVKELDRMGVLKPRWNNVGSPWRDTQLNANYELCGSYPSVLVVPASVTDDEIKAVSYFRSEQRVPVLCWGRQADSTSIWRSSQPKIGISRAACAEDEHMLASVAACSPARVLPIVDCRPRSTATANFAAGYGYESYPDCPLEFAGIGNIHVMRESLAKLEVLCLGNTAKDQDWTAVVEETRWLSHVRTVLSSAWTVAFKAHTQRTPVLVHCSHGWDRTSQVCSLAQVLLDPYYRTMDGFQVLIEKDWLAFGHPFHLRHAYGMPRGVNSTKDDQRSPIFLQFLDCTWQLVMQLPSYFEFNPRFLLCIADHIQTCRFGTFLCNSNKARRENGLETKCASLWTFLELHRPLFLSHLFQSDNQRELLPPLSSILRHVRLWSDYFLRWSPAPSFMPLPSPLRDSDSRRSNSSRSTADGDGRGDGGVESPSPETSSERARKTQTEEAWNTAFPIFRCEFDEIERWATLRGVEAMSNANASGDSESARRTPGGGDGSDSTQGSEKAVSEDLAAARMEIIQLKVALAEKEQLLNATRKAKALATVTPQRAKKSGTRKPHTAPSRPTRDRRGTSHGRTDESITATSRTHGDSALSAAAAAAALVAVEDDDEGWATSRPRGLSSTAESREVRRSSLSEGFEEDRGRCLTGASADLSYGDTGASGGGGVGASHVLRDDTDQGSSGWNWDFKPWNGPTKGKKRLSKPSSRSV